MDRLTILDEIFASRFLPIFYHEQAEVTLACADAVASGGARVFELTNRGPGALRTFERLVEQQSGKMKMIFGAGSIVDAETAAIFVAAGAQFIVGPSFNPEIAKFCHRRRILYVPGCATATEVLAAYESGCELVKLFPGQEVGGPSFVKALKGPIPWLSAVVTGGVEPTEASLKGWFDAGVRAVGLGSALFPKSAIDKGDYSEITRITASVVQIVQKFGSVAR